MHIWKDDTDSSKNTISGKTIRAKNSSFYLFMVPLHKLRILLSLMRRGNYCTSVCHITSFYFFHTLSPTIFPSMSITFYISTHYYYVSGMARIEIIKSVKRGELKHISNQIWCSIWTHIFLEAAHSKPFSLPYLHKRKAYLSTLLHDPTLFTLQISVETQSLKFEKLARVAGGENFLVVPRIKCTSHVPITLTNSSLALVGNAYML